MKRRRDVHRRAIIEKELASRVYQRVLRHGHVLRTDGCRVARRVMMAEVIVRELAEGRVRVDQG